MFGALLFLPSRSWAPDAGICVAELADLEVLRCAPSCPGILWVQASRGRWRPRPWPFRLGRTRAFLSERPREAWVLLQLERCALGHLQQRAAAWAAPSADACRLTAVGAGCAGRTAFSAWLQAGVHPYPHVLSLGVPVSPSRLLPRPPAAGL